MLHRVSCLLLVSFLLFTAARTSSESKEEPSPRVAPEDARALRQALQPSIDRLSPAAQELTDKAFALMEQGKTVEEIDDETDRLLDAAPLAVRQELERFEDQIEKALKALEEEAKAVTGAVVSKRRTKLHH